MQLKNGDALLIVDVQRDFLPGGQLAVTEGDAVIPPLNRCVCRFHAAGLPIVATRDWHPENHCSFVSQGGTWPPHCIRETQGAEFAEQLELPADTLVISKASRVDADAYSGFDGTGLTEHLLDAGVRRLFIGGLATDYCVAATVKDALEAGFEVCVLADAVRAVNLRSGDGDKALDSMRSAGARVIDHVALDSDGN